MKSPDIREPCGGRVDVPSLGGCFQHYVEDHQYISRSINITKVPDYANPPSAGGVDPYERKHNNGIGLGCWPDYLSCGNGVNGYKYCEIPTVLNEQFTTASSYNRIDQKGYYNFYTSSGTTDLSTCRKIGYKNVYAKKNWFGRYSYTPNGSNAKHADWCCACGEIPLQTMPETNKYLGLSSSFNWSIITSVGGVDTTVTSNAKHIVEVDKLTGVLINKHCSSGSSYPDPIYEAVMAEGAFSDLTLANTDATTIGYKYCQLLQEQADAGNTPSSITQTGDQAWTVKYSTTFDRCVDIDCTSIVTSTEIMLEIMVDLDNFRLEYITYGHDLYSMNWITTSHTIYEYSATAFNYSYKGRFISHSINGEGTASLSAELFNTYNESEVRAELNNLLGQWDLTDDVQYGWRTDDDVTTGPLVSRYESNESPSVGTPSCCTNNTSSLPFTGEILGKPLPQGYTGFWNPLHENWLTCTDLSCLETAYFIDGYGQNNEDGCHVPTATQWTTIRDSIDLPQGAFLGFNFRYTRPTCATPELLKDDVLWGCKWAEITNYGKPSINFARPCGYKDRYALSSSCCINGIIDPTTISLQTPFGFSEGKALIIGNGSLDGVYQVTSDGFYTVWLESLLISGSQLYIPYDAATDTGFGMIGYLMYQDDNKYSPICGRAEVISYTKDINKAATASFEYPVYLVDKDIIYLVDNNDIRTKVSCSYISNDTVAFSNKSGSIIPPKYIESIFGVDYRWNDDEPKHNLVTIDHSYNYRDTGEYNRLYAQSMSISMQYDCNSILCSGIDPLPPVPTNYYSSSCTTHCIAWDAASPSVICISPNNESFNSGLTLPFPSMILDADYGNYWIKEVKVTMDDPYYKIPPCPCEDDGFGVIGCSLPYLEDTGECLPDTLTEKYYAHIPQVEAMCESPLGAPPISPPYYIGCRDYSGNNTCNAPQIGIVTWNPWTLYLNELNCTCTGGRFKSEYNENGVYCNTSGIVPPP